MSTLHLVPEDLRDLYHVHEWRNAAGILKTACPSEWADIQDILRGFRLYRSEVAIGGGNRSPISPACKIPHRYALIPNYEAANAGGAIAGTARKQIETETGRKVVTSDNFLGQNQRVADPQRLSLKGKKLG